jgi:D-glycero-D-manno-heptose 1,7-bisphosphate phosphatase
LFAQIRRALQLAKFLAMRWRTFTSECVYYCPHGKQEGCLCRKPQPGLLLRARDELGCDLTDALFIGDSITDVQAAIRASVVPILVLTGRGVEQLMQHEILVQQKIFVQESLLTASEAILQGAYARPLKCVVPKR